MPLIMARPVVFTPPPPPPEPRFGDAGTGKQAAIELLIFLGVFLVTQIIGGLCLYAIGVRDPRWFNVVGTLVVGAMLLVAVLLIVRLGGRPLLTIGYRSDSPAIDIALGFGATFVILALFAAMAIFLSVFAPHLYATMEETPEAIRRTFPKMSPPLLMLLSAWVAVFEETLFRGYLLTRMHAIVRHWPATVFLGALVFALPHFYEGVPAMVMILALGVVMGALFVWRRSLVPVIVLHFFFNSVELMALYMTSPEWK